LSFVVRDPKNTPSYHRGETGNTTGALIEYAANDFPSLVKFLLGAMGKIELEAGTRAFFSIRDEVFGSLM